MLKIILFAGGLLLQLYTYATPISYDQLIMAENEPPLSQRGKLSEIQIAELPVNIINYISDKMPAAIISKAFLFIDAADRPIGYRVATLEDQKEGFLDFDLHGIPEEKGL